MRIRKTKKLSLGNLYAIRDWGHAKDYGVNVEDLQYKKPDDWIIATNKEKSVKSFINLVAKKLKLNLEWKGQGINEVAIIRKITKLLLT